MIRVTTIVWLALGTLIVVGLFHVKYQVQALEDEILRLNRQIVAEQEAIHVLHAEWSYVNQPQRLQSLSSRYLELQPLRPDQIINLAEFGRDSLDAVVPPAAPPSRAIVLTPPRPREANANQMPGARATRATHTPVLVPPIEQDDR